MAFGGVSLDVHNSNGISSMYTDLASTTFQNVLDTLKTGQSTGGAVLKQGSVHGTGQEIGLSLTEGGTPLTLSSLVTSVFPDEGGGTLYALYPEPSDTLRIYSDDTKTTLLGTYTITGNPNDVPITTIASNIGISIPQNANGFYYDGTTYGLNDPIRFRVTLTTVDGYFTYPKIESITGFYLDGTEYKFEGGGTEYYAGKGIAIGDTVNSRRGPSPEGFHVPAIAEWQGVKTIMDGLSLTTGDSWRINLHMPFAGGRSYSTADLSYQGSRGFYWSSSSYSAGSYHARNLGLNSSGVYANDSNERAGGLSVRCFKDSYVVPDSSWTVVQGTLGSAGIFWNQTEGLISITSNGTIGYTIQDKNLGATTVYNDGDTLSEANCGKYYQWGNNYGFAWTGSITTSSSKVDASGYGPSTANGYYESNIFITGDGDWSFVPNDDLWGDTSGTITIENVITNTGVLSVNGQTGNVIVQSGSEASGVTTTQPSNPVAGSTYYDTTSLAVKVYDGTQWNELGSGGGGGGLGLEYMGKVTLNGSGDGEHWLNTGVGSLAYDAYVVCLTNSTCRFILGVELGDYNYPRPANNDIRNGIMQVSGDSKWLKAGDKLFIYDYNGSGAVYNFYIYKFTRPS